MKTGLTKKQKTTSIFFTDADDMIEVCTRNTPLKNRLAAFAEEYPSECRLIDDDENGCQTYEIRKGRFGFRLTPPILKNGSKLQVGWQRITLKI